MKNNLSLNISKNSSHQTNTKLLFVKGILNKYTIDNISPSPLNNVQSREIFL